MFWPFWSVFFFFLSREIQKGSLRLLFQTTWWANISLIHLVAEADKFCQLTNLREPEMRSLYCSTSAWYQESSVQKINTKNCDGVSVTLIVVIFYIYPILACHILSMSKTTGVSDNKRLYYKLTKIVKFKFHLVVWLNLCYVKMRYGQKLKNKQVLFYYVSAVSKIKNKISRLALKPI